MRVKHQAQKHKMTKGMNAAMSWVPSVFTQKELNKTRTEVKGHGCRLEGG
jgi:hypothetical protein